MTSIVLILRPWSIYLLCFQPWSFPGADIGSERDLVMMTFLVRLKKARKPNQPRLKFDLEKLRDPDVACTFSSNDRWEVRTTHWPE